MVIQAKLPDLIDMIVDDLHVPNIQLFYNVSIRGGKRQE